MAQWQQARLFSVAGIENDADARGRATEALLSVISMVPSFAATLLQPLGVRVDSRTEVKTYVDVALGTKASETADGVIEVAKGRSSWTAAVVVRTGQGRLTAAAVKRIGDAASREGLDAVITIANDPNGPDLGRSRSKTGLHHWAWGALVASAVDMKIRDVEQAEMLGHLAAFLGCPDARVVSFGDMGASWNKVLKTARTSRLSPRDAGVVDVCARWAQVVKHLGVKLGNASGLETQQVLSRALAADPDKQLSALVENAATNSQLDGVLRVTGAAGDLAIVADLAGRRLVSVVVVSPPEGLGSRATVGWLLDGLEQAPVDAVVESWARSGRSPRAVATVEDLARDMSALEDSRGRLGDSYRVLMATEMATPRSSGSRSPGFIDGVTAFVLETWAQVLAPLSGIEAKRSRRPKTTSPGRASTKAKSRKPSSRTKPKPSTTTSRSTQTSAKKTSTRSSAPRSTPTRSTTSSRSSGGSSRRKSASDLAKELRRER